MKCKCCMNCMAVDCCSGACNFQCLGCDNNKSEDIGKEIKDILVELIKGGKLKEYDLDVIINSICRMDDGYKYDVLTHRFFDGERYNGLMPKGWFCHLTVYSYDEENEDWYKNDDKCVKVYGGTTPKESVIKALKILLKDRL